MSKLTIEIPDDVYNNLYQIRRQTDLTEFIIIAIRSKLDELLYENPIQK